MISGKIGVVTVTYNSEPYLEQFINSLASQNYFNYNTYIIDNSSQDNTVSLLNMEYRNRGLISVVANTDNLGVAAGNNQGILMALNDGCEWVLLLNNDTSFPPDFLSQLVASCDRHGWRVVVPKIHFDSPSGHIWYGGGGFNPRRGYTGYHTGIGEPDRGQFDVEATVDYSPTCAMLVHRSVFNDVGLMDESYFVYFDDTDFCWRLKQAGISIGYMSATSLVHKVGGSTGGTQSPFTARMTSRNRLYYLKKHFGMLSATLWMPVFLLYYIGQFMMKRNFAWLKASFKGTFEYPQMVKREPRVPKKIIS
jgi:GT2 family glycosyltransferase